MACVGQCVKALFRNRATTFLTCPVGAIFNPRKRDVNLRQRIFFRSHQAEREFLREILAALFCHVCGHTGGSRTIGARFSQRHIGHRCDIPAQTGLDEP